MEEEKTNAPNNFEFECPQFTDFTKDINRVSEEFCQEYFDKKHEEIKRKSAEFQAQNMMMDVDTDNDGGNSSENDKENRENQAAPPTNLMSHSDFTNTSNTSFMSSKSSESNTSHIPTHCEDRHRKLGKNRVPISSEQMELAKLEQKKSEIQKLKEKNAKHVAKMRDDGLVFHPTRSTKLTIPITPALHTTMRAQSRLRKERKRKMSAQTAEEHAKHHPLSHGHSHGHSGGQCPGNNQISKKHKPTHPMPTKTIPQSFKLSKTKRRRASSAVLTTEQKEMREIEKRGAFHARKLNPKIFKSNAGNMGILNNIKNKMTTTTVQPFHLRTERRAHKHEEREMKGKERGKIKEKERGKQLEKERENKQENPKQRKMHMGKPAAVVIEKGKSNGDETKTNSNLEVTETGNGPSCAES